MVQILDCEDGDQFLELWSLFMACDYRPSLFVDRAFLEGQGMLHTVDQALAASGWASFAHLSCETNVQDTCEFLASVQASEDERGIVYRHRGVWYIAGPQDLRSAFGFERAPTAERDGHSNLDLWSELTGGEGYISGKCNATSIREPWIFYLHRVMTRSITGRKAGAHKPSVADMEILRGLYYRRRAPYGQTIAHHWIGLRPTGEIHVGGMVTHYLRSVHGAEPLPHHDIIAPEFLTRDVLRRMRAVRVHRIRGLEWCYRRAVVEDVEEQPVEQQLPEPQQPQRRLRRCSQTGESSRAAAVPAFGAEELTWMFNASRAFDFISPPGTSISVPPPSGWLPGQDIPPGYQWGHQGSSSRAHEHPAEEEDDSDSDD